MHIIYESDDIGLIDKMIELLQNTEKFVIQNLPVLQEGRDFVSYVLIMRGDVIDCEYRVVNNNTKIVSYLEIEPNVTFCYDDIPF